jgi:hypothetical protein
MQGSWLKTKTLILLLPNLIITVGVVNVKHLAANVIFVNNIDHLRVFECVHNLPDRRLRFADLSQTKVESAHVDRGVGTFGSNET